MAYGTPTGTAGLCRNILGGAGDFTASTCPQVAQVEYWLSSGCAVIESHLSSVGYSVPPSVGVVVYDWLADLNNLYAAARVEMSRVNVTLGPGERTRGQVFEQMFWQGLRELASLDLTLAGLSRVADDKIYVGGTTYTEKDDWEDDSDRVPPRFFRGQHSFPGTIRPDDYSISGS